MNRCLIVASFSLALTSSALAQTKRGRDYELQFVSAALGYGAAALDTSKVVVDRLQSTALRAFARQEIQEQLDFAALPKLIAADDYNVAPQQQPKLDDRLAIGRLKEADAVDRGYRDVQRAIHDQQLQASERYLQKGEDQTYRAIASLVRARSAEHAAVLKTLKL